ncbi:uncharacterized protein LOC129237299 [Anastrepha obliqua]|uniref:uncharacterized protein LOC129237299 n=1 Tax=Anastrepha obliqua TaxID=95512 RepID=UPI002409B32D|nr:uncharacterized protein LOC129237299 [Anastrepha obliqua]
MSRFGLRSSSDIFKVSEEQANRKKIGTDSKMPLKRACQKKKKTIGLENDGKLNESSNQKEENKPSVSIVCSLPLNRLTGFIEKLNTNNLSFDTRNQYSQKTSHNEEKIVERVNLCEKQTNRAAYDNVGSNHQEFDECTSPLEESIRILCLYCDKKFTSYKMQLKHVEKFHIQNKNRRCSGRNSQMAPLSDSKKQRVEPCSNVLAKYPGCTYCKRSKSHQIEASTKDLNGLFLHFIDCHSDKYFGCKACMQRFQNVTKLSRHMQTVHKDTPLLQDDSPKNKEFDFTMLLEKDDSEKNSRERGKATKARCSKLQKNVNIMNIVATSPEDPSPTNSNTIMGAEEPILSRLGLAQNRLPNSRKGVRSRKDSILSDSILKPDQPSVYMSAVKARNKSGKNAVRESGDAEVVFRMPTRTEMLSSVFDENFYRDVVSNVRHNLLYYLDGKLFGDVGSAINMNTNVSAVKHQIPTIRSTLAESPVVLDGSNALDSEIHAATSLSTVTAFPTLLTAEQYGGDAVLSKIRRPHTKHSWKWKWDSVKKFKLINEGGKIVKKMKQPMLGLRDLSKLDMWTQLSMRQKHEIQQYILNAVSHANESVREEKQRINEQLNYILDMRLLPHIILEQNEQAIIKIENDEFGTLSYLQNTEEDGAENILNQSFADDTFFSVLELLPNHELQCHRNQLVLSGEWARPRCYLCMCCGAKFEKLKSLEEHKMFRHSHVLSTHYEVVGRELLAGNSLRHLFIPNRALSYYGNESYSNPNIIRKFGWRKIELHDMNRRMITGDDDSSDSIQSTVNSCTLNAYSAKHSTTTDECDTDTKTTLDINTGSPSNSMQSSNSLFTAPLKLHLKCKDGRSISTKCSKCTRRCNGTLDLYRHMLDCSGDYIWSLAKKRKYRYYCGSKKRRSWNKHNFAELRKKQPKISKPSPPSNDTEESVSSSKVKTPSRPRPSDAESIKKMLENLPPKRICKKIFPALTKTKKSKFITKHKIFSSQGRLRSTRARKMSKLSKAKSKYSNKATKNKKVLHHKAEKIMAKHKSKNLLKLDRALESNTSMNIFSKNLEKENLRNSKSPNDKLPPTDMTVENKAGASVETDTGKCKTPSTPAKEKITAVECTAEPTNIALDQGNIPTESRICDSLRSNKSGQQTDLQNRTALDSSANYEVKNNSQYTDNVTCNKKRSKKINDCIAMLTGKLEEKLKTEQNSLNKDEPCIEADISSEQKTKSGSEIKPPKRKTLSRKIIKMDNITTHTTLAKVQTELVSTTIGPTNIPKLPSAPIVPNAANAKMISTIPTSSNTVSTISTSKTSTQTSSNVNYLPKAANINLLQENKKCSLLNKQATQIITVNMDPVMSTLPTISLPTSNVNTALLLSKQPAAMIVDKMKKIPPTLSHSNPITELVPSFPTLPLALPMQSIQQVNASIPPPPPPVLSVLPQPSLLSTPVPITPVVPVAPMAPIVPVAPMTPILPVAPMFNSEPLNLSNTKNIKKHNPNDLVCLPPYRSGLPVRRQTICGFEARNFILEDEPLDLSKKSNKDQTQDVSAVITLMPMVKPIETHPITPVGINLAIAPHQDAALNKQFYSNLELLKIPQIRNPANTTSSEAVFVNSTPKCASKKRSGGKTSTENTSKQVASSSGKGTNKETSVNKKDNLLKGKASQKMDDEVINHIDDAINSVINAVKASLPDNDEENNGKNYTLIKESNNEQPDIPISLVNLRKPAHVESMPQTQPTSSAQVVTKPPLLDTSLNLPKCNEEATKNEEENTKTIKPLVFLPQKRYARSKTLDCRPNVLAITPEIVSDSLQHIPDEPVPVPKQNVTAANTLTTPKNSECPTNIENFPEGITECPNIDYKLKPRNGENPLQDPETLLCHKTSNDLSFSNETQIIEKEPSSFPAEPHIEINKCVSPAVETFNEINPNMITEENMSNINNTSSGFHSCGQVENTVEAKKKQRRRRKNELAAIVADQLLESFKIDKTRRDNLKKLENLAYEKSEDLFVTGMLLMSSTKRNVTCSKTEQLNNDVNANKNSEGASRQKQDQQSKTKTSKVRHKPNASCNKSLQLTDTVTAATSINNAPSEKSKEKDVVVKRNKKRNYRGKGKPLDNENISKLKSSLESFSIGIEKQLTELEARSSATINISETKVLNPSPAAVRPSLIRPSILSANMESSINDHKAPIIESKSAVSSRDPRLNKNIHKNENNEFSETTDCEKDKNMEEIGDVEEDNYLTEIAKNVNEKIMSSENEEFMFMNDGFELANELQDDSNSKFYSRPPTSMSVRSAPNFNDDRSNFGSICDENTNTEVMDMDLEDELSVYTSYSQDVGRGRGRRRRRRRSILLKRRPKKRVNHDTSAEKFECTLCKKIFYTLNSLTKHNMTLAHVSKLSAQEYLLSKTLEKTSTTQINATDKDPQKCMPIEFNVSKKSADRNDINRIPELKQSEFTELQHNNQERVHNANSIERRELNDGGKGKTPFNNASRLNLNPDERLFFECCNILKGAETACVNNGDDNNGGGVFEYNFKDKPQMNVVQSSSFKCLRSEIPKKQFTPERASCKSGASQHEFRSPPVLPSTIVNKGGPTIPRASSPNYSGASQFSAVTNATSRFKTKAAMKGYENTNIDLTICKELETKSPAVCKLTELAEIALGNEKSDSPEFTSLSNQQEGSIFRPITSREYITSSAAVDNPKNCGDGNDDRIKSSEAHSSTSSKTIMHSSKIKSVVEEHSKETCRKIVIPDRPFKNIGLEEKETITFQKPKTSINLLTDDNSVSTTSYSDRDDFDFASMSCDEEPSPKVSNERNVKNNSDSSSSRATAKTFENKSLIMDRIFKNMGTKAKSSVKVQSIGIQKDPPPPKADINQLFDELRGDCGAKIRPSENVLKKHTSLESTDNLQAKQRQTTSQAEVPLPFKRVPRETRKKSNVSAKSQKEITRLQSELGMSQEEIVKLINEGQRKSKRRCATNRPKKLVEMWSSDEYEEFLSTKDIIALIEEKEKQETRKKRKIANQLSTCNNKTKVIETPKLIANRRKSVRCVTEKEEKLLGPSTELQKSECGKTNGAAKIQNNHMPTHSLESKGKNTRSCTVAESDIKLKNSISSELNHKSTTNRINNKKKKPSKANSEAVVVPKSLALIKDTKKASKIESSPVCAKDTQPEKDEKTDKYLSELKQTNSRTRNSREKKYSDSKEIVNNVKTLNREPCTSVVVSKKHINNKNNNSQSYKSRRKNQSNQSPPRRKRLASEKLYYWSSSSDEDFGKINSTCAQEFDGGEQYQKHGWIVGDSHKKLVTLLAIAKGNKKVDNSCGVKKNVCRKKN